MMYVVQFTMALASFFYFLSKAVYYFHAPPPILASRDICQTDKPTFILLCHFHLQLPVTLTDGTAWHTTLKKLYQCHNEAPATGATGIVA